jgi:hypothetical protein
MLPAGVEGSVFGPWEDHAAVRRTADPSTPAKAVGRDDKFHGERRPDGTWLEL